MLDLEEFLLELEVAFLKGKNRRLRPSLYLAFLQLSLAYPELPPAGSRSRTD